ncbi:MAG: PilZ domain-containing protein, partial [Planctomycetota bacterium]
MDQALPPDDPLRAHFSGKRKWERIPCLREVVVEGVTGNFDGIVSDISEGGALLEVTTPTFYEAEQSDGFSLVHREFPNGLVIHFKDSGVRVEADVVRITPEGGHGLSLGCRFSR